MTDNFDSYYIWLGIPPDEQPPNHYRLLAINQFETNLDAIESAADRQMAHLRTFQSGKHGAMSQRLLNEVAIAKINLLDPRKKVVYDERLRSQWANMAAAAEPPPEPPGPAASRRANPPVAERLGDEGFTNESRGEPTAVATDDAADWDDMLGAAASSTSQIHKTGSRKSTVAGQSTSSHASSTTASRKLPAWVIAGPIVGVLFVLGICAYLNNRPEPPPEKNAFLVLDWRPTDRRGLALFVDDERIPPTGIDPWEITLTPGQHHIVARRTGYKPQEITVTAESQGRVHVGGAAWRPRATLAINWPVADRGGAELKIDGIQQSFGEKQPLEIAVDPGEHTIDLRRLKAAPLQLKSTVSADQRQTIDVPASVGKLLVVWPMGERAGGEFKIDGVVKRDLNRDPVELTLPVGDHHVTIARPGFKPFEASAKVMAAENLTISVAWTPVSPPTHVVTNRDPNNPKENPANRIPGPTDNPGPIPGPGPEKPADEPKPPVSVTVKLPVPAATDRERVAKQVEQLYKTTHSNNPDEDAAHVKELFDLATKSKDQPVDRYVLFTKGIELSLDAGEVSLAMDGIDNLTRDYVVDGGDLKQKAIDKLSRSATREDSIVELVAVAERLAEEAIGDDKYDTAMTLMTAASRAAAKKAAGADYRKEVEKRLNLRRADVKLAQAMFAVVEKAQTTLESDAADPDANSSVGRWLCFHKLQWDEGLPYLKKSKDDKLKAVAAMESPPPDQAEKQAAIADAWVELMPNQPVAFRDAIAARAGEWYERAVSHLGAGLLKLRIEKKIKELADSRGDKTGKPTGGRSLNNSIGMRLALIPAGEFVMGSPVAEQNRGGNETQHKVRITKPFYLGAFPVTQAEYARVVGSNPSYFSASNNRLVAASRVDTSRFPVEQVSADDAEGFCRLLGESPKEKAAGRRYRLPTEAEWEYSCRAGTTTAYSFGPTINLQMANYSGGERIYDFAPGAKQSTTPVGVYKANAFGLFDMHGNVFEICKDWTGRGDAAEGAEPVDDPQGPGAGFSKITRGGCFSSSSSQCRSAYRGYIFPSGRFRTTGFRVACDTPGTTTAAKPTAKP